MNIYISGAFSSCSNLLQTFEKYEKLAVILQKAGFQVYIPHLHTSPITNADVPAITVFKTDQSELDKAELIVAFIDQPSFGVGAEIALALCNGKKVIGIYKESLSISRFIQGLLETAPNGYCFPYQALEEICDLVESICSNEERNTNSDLTGLVKNSNTEHFASI